MKLTHAQLDDYDRQGYLVLPELFSQPEVDTLLAEVKRVSALDVEGIFREGEGGQAKSMFRLHETDGPTASAPFRAALRAPRCLGVAQQVMREGALYLHHCKVNMKAAIQGTAWPWHQDFGAWHLDGIKQPDMATMMIMLHDATPANGCLYFLPGSHQAHRVDPYFDTSTAYKLWAVGPERMRELMQRFEAPVPVTGKAGTAAIFHCNLLHASGHNLSPVDRWQAYFCFNTVANRPHDVPEPRPDYVRSRNWAPLTLADNPIARESAIA